MVCLARCLGICCWGFPGEYLSDWWYAGALFLGELSCFRGFYDNFLSLFICNLQSHSINKLNLIIKLRIVFVIFIPVNSTDLSSTLLISDPDNAVY